MTSDLVLLSPLDGWACSLAEVPDAVFAEAMLGDGAAIDPTSGVLRAPCDAVVFNLHAARHALSLRTAEGVEILLHVGLETVALGGEGFEAQVAAGQSVRAGDPLLRFDLDRLARRAASLISPMVITEAAGFTFTERRLDQVVSAGQPWLRLSAGTKAAASVARSAGPSSTRAVVVPLAHGLHARPAARIAQCATAYGADVTVAWAGREASARSPVGLMALGLQQGDTAMLSAAGPDAGAALSAIAALIESGMGEAHAPAPVPAPRQQAKTPRSDGRLQGVMAAPGLAIGIAARLSQPELAVAEQGQGVAHERAALTTALAEVAAQIAQAAARDPDPTRRAILNAHAAFLGDPTLSQAAERLIGEGKSAGYAWRSAVGGFIDALKSLADRRMAERVDDLLDLERRVLSVLAGDASLDAELPAGAILLADELLPSQLMAIPAGRLAGLCTGGGGPTSHVAILAAAMGIPAVVAVGPGLGAIPEGATLILDADAATLEASPGAAALGAAQGRLAARAARREAARNAARDPAKLADGTPLPVLANLGSLAEAQAAVAGGAEGCGLLRTEFLFLDRETAPDEDEQAERYQAIADALGDRPLVVRLLDIGGDKPVAYLPSPDEENPALGVRGVRLLLRRPQLLRTQLRAILRVTPRDRFSIMVPMISRLSELRAVRAALDEARRDLATEGRVDLGVMIETPAAAMIADQLSREADFLSIGTNDLTQYALAMDRGQPDLAAEVDGLDPAVLRLIRQACQGGASQGLVTSVCGGLAGDPAAIPILIGLGVSKLSMASVAIPEAKAMIRTLSAEACRRLAEAALAETSAEAVRALSDVFLNGGA
ncbi:phosphoenolpyruvate--protein phosphotransferase [Phenylobacterium sp.]|jgi:phosphocarrier protein FPr/phosphocarrier protein|uniref:phosphoenolpyruvate--protein phosphotransferase n=1 Tax=Phenylobacterium sp. TaxID=1871053 RepID=UPI002E312ABE|nr:phosphoenolpyruvate--protein phosphotransferase [Phenylobacterium sp.]HEX3367921.1 phosphoenolpyruvate--protein phosphotransferase [Phenylobacterium sp.]